MTVREDKRNGRSAGGQTTRVVVWTPGMFFIFFRRFISLIITILLSLGLTTNLPGHKCEMERMLTTPVTQHAPPPLHTTARRVDPQVLPATSSPDDGDGGLAIPSLTANTRRREGQLQPTTTMSRDVSLTCLDPPPHSYGPLNTAVSSCSTPSSSRASTCAEPYTSGRCVTRPGGGRRCRMFARRLPRVFHWAWAVSEPSTPSSTSLARWRGHALVVIIYNVNIYCF